MPSILRSYSPTLVADTREADPYEEVEVGAVYGQIREDQRAILDTVVCHIEIDVAYLACMIPVDEDAEPSEIRYLRPCVDNPVLADWVVCAEVAALVDCEMSAEYHESLVYVCG